MWLGAPLHPCWRDPRNPPSGWRTRRSALGRERGRTDPARRGSAQGRVGEGRGGRARRRSQAGSGPAAASVARTKDGTERRRPVDARRPRGGRTSWRSALGARRSALGARRSALGARRSALGARRSALIIPPGNPGKVNRIVVSPLRTTPMYFLPLTPRAMATVSGCAGSYRHHCAVNLAVLVYDVRMKIG